MRPESGPRRTARLEGVLSVIKVYSFAAWAYVALIAVFHPQTLGLRLTHLASWPHEDTFGIACFAVSFTSALTLAMLRARR